MKNVKVLLCCFLAALCSLSILANSTKTNNDKFAVLHNFTAGGEASVISYTNNTLYGVFNPSFYSETSSLVLFRYNKNNFKFLQPAIDLGKPGAPSNVIKDQNNYYVMSSNNDGEKLFSYTQKDGAVCEHYFKPTKSQGLFYCNLITIDKVNNTIYGLVCNNANATIESIFKYKLNSGKTAEATYIPLPEEIAGKYTGSTLEKDGNYLYISGCDLDYENSIIFRVDINGKNYKKLLNMPAAIEQTQIHNGTLYGIRDSVFNSETKDAHLFSLKENGSDFKIIKKFPDFDQLLGFVKCGDTFYINATNKDDGHYSICKLTADKSLINLFSFESIAENCSFVKGGNAIYGIYLPDAFAPHVLNRLYKLELPVRKPQKPSNEDLASILRYCKSA